MILNRLEPIWFWFIPRKKCASGKALASWEDILK
jgi:hypothetical protein